MESRILYYFNFTHPYRDGNVNNMLFVAISSIPVVIQATITRVYIHLGSE